MLVLLAVEDGASIWFTLLGLLSLPTLVALNGYFVAAEFALVAVRRTRVERMVTDGVKGASAVLHTVDHLDQAIAATQLGITLASLGLGWVSEQALAHLLELAFAGFPSSVSLVARHSIATTVTFLIITFAHVVFGELFPKSVALQMPDRVALWVAYPLSWFELLTRPLTSVMNATGNSIVRLCGFKPSAEHLIHSVEELSLLIEDSEEAGELDPEQAELVQNVFELTNKEVKDCMVPRDKMAALELTSPSDRILEAVRTGAHTRMPVYDGQVDNIVGIVNTKDLFYLFSLQGVVVLEDALYPPLYLKPDESVATALRLFRSAKRPMALVRDETGTIHGVVTLEDILEEIVGDIEDEHDRPTPKLARRKLRRPPPPPPSPPSPPPPPLPPSPPPRK